ncbi:hypothetical protein NDU88_006138 [Pleurodeles waltl]|uniref:Uncharacterized protein n=1 Tax=Pleurodeles waltl TaxID=8319 RepID=A0AAV7WDJ0_PLEWA|nr:hypothetical protein NDU88_006138 [Pleurodeles waltl]
MPPTPTYKSLNFSLQCLKGAGWRLQRQCLKKEEGPVEDRHFNGCYSAGPQDGIASPLHEVGSDPQQEMPVVDRGSLHHRLGHPETQLRDGALLPLKGIALHHLIQRLPGSARSSAGTSRDSPGSPIPLRKPLPPLERLEQTSLGRRVSPQHHPPKERLCMLPLRI